MIELKIPRDDSWNQIDEDIRLARALLKAIDEEQ